MLKQALEAADVKGFRQRKRESRKRGKLRGLGIGCFLEVTAPPIKEMGGIALRGRRQRHHPHRHARLRQGHAAPFAQVLSDKLGIPFERIRLLQGDSDELLAGGGTGGSNSMMHSGTAIVEASAKVIEQGKQIASHVLEASAADIEFAQRTLRHRRHRPRDRHHGARRKAPLRHQSAGGRADHRSTSITSATAPARPPIPTAAMSARSRSIPTPA